MDKALFLPYNDSVYKTVIFPENKYDNNGEIKGGQNYETDTANRAVNAHAAGAHVPVGANGIGHTVDGGLSESTGREAQLGPPAQERLV